jgi:ribosomal protein S18 acetylase RimI-like enzyme
MTEIRSAAASEEARAIGVLVLAFSADPMTRWIFPDAHDYATYFPAGASAFGGNAFAHGTAYCADRFSGVALWLPPDVQPRDEEMAALLQRAVPERRLSEVFEVTARMADHHPPEPHWYLPLIGVDPVHQGRGHGSALMAHALVRCDDAGQPAYLESSNPANIPLYQRHGFELLGTIQFGSSPPIYPMLRRPRPR